MVFSETPDMSDSNQDFTQRGQQAAPPPPPPPPSQNSTGGRNMDPRGPTNSGGSAGRMGNGPSSSGNWNGNNHLGNGQQPQDALSSVAGHMTHEPSYQGYPHPQQKPHQNTQHNGVGHYRGPQHPNHSHSERYAPYHRPPLPNHNHPDPRSTWR